MSYLRTKPVEWKVHRLMCECGGEFEHKFSIKYADKPFTHVCNKCSSVENMEDIYPKPKWMELC